ncbi:transcriptional regulator, LacI family [Fodinibius roseus]|uniref:Transcriptional regulator, LacI family n=1 Tax=Fodinibius roseus TaxID=1194090 RepID=A0A1M5BKI2_9BACT|nr:LacI family DNA-binding transcriptional regulator [Fodinibius roseus]SHF43123.1 transcriptional regulator, LacI family [Fodinibius roseus]
MKVTLKDIAEDTGYSISTVSRVLNGSDKISSKTTRKIYQSAQRLNYPILNRDNDTYADKALKNICIATEFRLGEFYSSLFFGLDRAAQKSRIHLSMTSLPQTFTQSLQMLQRLVEDHYYEGLILYAPGFRREHYQKLFNTLPKNFPIVSNALIENPVLPTVTFDGYSGGFMAAEHLYDQGYKKCGILKGPMEKPEARYRLNGFRDYITQTRDMELIWTYDGNFSFKSGQKAFEAFHNTADRPRALFASNDNMGHAFLEEAISHHYHIPDDVALIGYDDMPICRRHQPTISSINTDYEKLGMVTMEKIKEVINNPVKRQGVLSLVPVTVEAREST